MGLNDRITERFEVTTNVSIKAIFDKIVDGKQKQTLTDTLVFDTIDYQEININNSGLEIIRLPSTLSAFRPNGKILIGLSNTADNKTHLKCEILPYNGGLLIMLVFLIVALSLWTIVTLLILRNISSLFITFAGWTVFGLFMYLHFLNTKRRLVDYTNKVIKELTNDKQASR